MICMKQKKIIIVGASSGIGLAIAIEYVNKGWKVGITGRRESLLQELKERYPDQVALSCFDVRNEKATEYLDRLIEEMGGMDVLLYNSGYGETSMNLVPSIETQTTETNVDGFVRIVVHAFNHFVQECNGQIALTSSVAALRGNSWGPAYSASKSFMSNYAEGLNIKARKLKKDIIITDLRPGFVDTHMGQGKGRFWVSSPENAARQMFAAIEKKKRIAYITRRWWIIGQVMKILPFGLYRRIA